jgi:recombination protein RecA
MAKGKGEAKSMGKKSSDEEGRAKALNLAVDQIEKQFGKGAIMHLEGDNKIDVETTPTGSVSLDLALGGGHTKR